MPQKTWVWILIALGAVLIVGMLFQSKYDLFATLPPGEIYSNSNCTFISNTDIGIDGEQIGDFGSPSTKWIAVDWDNNGTKEGYGYYSSTGSTGDTCAGREIITTTPGGLKVVKNDEKPLFKEIRVCSGGTAFNYRNSSSNAINATLTCESICTPSCISKVCGDDGCGGTCGSCSVGYVCSSGQCISGTGGCLIQDSDSDGKLGRSELGIAIQRWVVGT